jgi:uncharacterized protein YcsI (UPF0317 family)
MPLTSAQRARLDIREGRHTGSTRGVALGYVQCNLVIVRREHAYDFLVYCQRNPKACPVIEVTEPGATEAILSAPGSDVRTDVPRYAVYRRGRREADVVQLRELWEPTFVSFLIGSGITFDQALERAGVPTDRYRWVLRSQLATVPAGVFRGPLVVTMRWLTPAQAIVATQVTARFPWYHGAPIHLGEPAEIGADVTQPLFGGEVGTRPPGLVPVFWACGVTPQAAAETAGIDLMITHAPAHGLVTDLKADEVCLP